MSEPKQLDHFSHADVLRRLTALQAESGPEGTPGTRRDLANVLGVHETYVSQIYNGNKELTDRVLSKLEPPLERRMVYVRKSLRKA
jgi:hypothetical protein